MKLARVSALLLFMLVGILSTIPLGIAAQAIIAHNVFQGQDGVITATAYVYKDIGETVPDKDFYAFKVRVHSTKKFNYAVVSIYSPQGICDAWEPTQGTKVQGIISFASNGISFNIWIPNENVWVSGAYTHTIKWETVLTWTYTYDMDFAAGFYVPQGSEFGWAIDVKAEKYNAYGRVWGDTAAWYFTPGEEIYRTSGTLSGTGTTYTFSASSLSGPYTVVMVGNEAADFDLYAKWNSPPTYYNYDAIGWSGYSSEYFSVSGSGTLYTMVRSYRGSGHWSCNVVTGNPSANGGRKVGSLSGSGATYTYSISGTGRAWVYLAGPDSGDYDLYLKWNSPPTTTSYDVRGWTGWSQEICNAEGSGTLYYMVRSYRGSGQYTMLALIF